MAINAQELQGQWNTLRGQVKHKWGQLTDDDIVVLPEHVDLRPSRADYERTISDWSRRLGCMSGFTI